MDAAGKLLEGSPPRRSNAASPVLARLLTSARFYVYLSCTAVALITTWHLGKEMLWDTLDYHFYAGFSAVHNRFGLDYFPAAWQAYLYPYVYAPFYLLATSGLTALQVALILGAIQSGILWLTYELALIVAPAGRSRVRLAIGVCAVALAFANPVLINEMGSTFCDITTAEVALAGWVLILAAVRSPGVARVVCAAALLGAASALKLTNAVAAVGAAPMVLFIPGEWRTKLRNCGLFAFSLLSAFVLVAAPWSIRLEERFGNPFFPLFNGIFRSPYFTTSRLVDQRFTPTSIGAALRLPFDMVLPRNLIDVEWAAPDVRYALLLVLGVLALALWVWRFLRKGRIRVIPAEHDPASRALGALACGFLTAWAVWVTASGNGRYFLPMACVAAVLGVALLFRLFAPYNKARNYILAAVFALQLFQLHAGTEYHDDLPWGDASWFDVSVPSSIASQPALYFSVGMQSNSFVLPYLARGSGFVNLEGIYTLSPQSPNGQRVQALMKKFSPHLRVLMRDWRLDPAHEASGAVIGSVDDALQPFGLRADASTCSKIIVRGVSPLDVTDGTHAGAVPPTAARSKEPIGYLITCRVVPYQETVPGLLAGERAADLALDHLEEACPELFQPRGMATYFLGDKNAGYIYVRRYPNTDVAAWVSRKWVRFQRLLGGGQEQYVGPEKIWEKGPSPVSCKRTAGGDYLKVLAPSN